MIATLEKAGQEIPKELTDMANNFRSKVGRGEAQWYSSGFVGKGFTFDATEMNETQKLASMQKRAYEIEQGIFGEEEDVVYDEDEEDNEESNTTGAENSAQQQFAASTSESSVVNDSTASSLTSSFVPPPPPPLGTLPGMMTSGYGATTMTSSSSSMNIQPAMGTGANSAVNMSAIERARAMAISLGINKSVEVVAPVAPPLPLGPPPSSVPLTADGKVDTKAAMARAKLIAMQMSGSDSSGKEMHYSEELEINDYPPQVNICIWVLVWYQLITLRLLFVFY